MISDPKELSDNLFSKAIEEKRKGNFNEAIRLQQKSIYAHPNIMGTTQNFYALGKIFYLWGKYEYAVGAYFVCVNLSIINNPAMLDDYKSAKIEDPSAQIRLASFLMHPARHIGHAVFDPQNNDHYGTEIKNYRDSLMGRDTPQRTKREDEYDDAVINRTLPFTYKKLDEALADMPAFKNKTLSTIDDFLNIKFK